MDGEVFFAAGKMKYRKGWKMDFYRIPRDENGSDEKKFLVYMRNNHIDRYVCEMIDDETDEAKEVNEKGLTLRSRLCRSKGKYVMTEGTIFNPSRLIDAACMIQSVEKKEYKGEQYKDGYTLLTITADNCTNTYMIFSEEFLIVLEREIERKKRYNV